MSLDEEVINKIDKYCGEMEDFFDETLKDIEVIGERYIINNDGSLNLKKRVGKLILNDKKISLIEDNFETIPFLPILFEDLLKINKENFYILIQRFQNHYVGKYDFFVNQDFEGEWIEYFAKKV